MSEDDKDLYTSDAKINIIIVCVGLIGIIIASGAYFIFKNNQTTTPDYVAAAQALNEIEPALGISELNEMPPQPKANINNAPMIQEADYREEETKNGLDPKTFLEERGLGNPNAPIRVDEFASLTCSHCATFHKNTFKQLKEKYIDTGKVYFVFNDFPLNAPALKGSIVARCLPQERYYSFLDLLFKTQDQWAANQDYIKNLRQNSKLAGLEDSQFDQCINNTAIETALVKSVQIASQKWGINSTPSFIVNKEKVINGAQPIDQFETIFAELLEQDSPTTE